MYLVIVQKCSNVRVPIPRGPKIQDIIESYKEHTYLKYLWLPIFGNIRIKWLQSMCYQTHFILDVQLVFTQILSSFHWNIEEKYLKNLMEFIIYTQQNHSYLKLNWNHVFLCAKNLSITSSHEHWKCFRTVMDFHHLEPLVYSFENIQEIIQVMVSVCEQMASQTIQNHEMFVCSTIFLDSICFQTNRKHISFQIHLSNQALDFIRHYTCQDVHYHGNQLVLRIQQLFLIFVEELLN